MMSVYPQDFTLRGYCDADYASYHDNKNSGTDYLIFFAEIVAKARPHETFQQLWNLQGFVVLLYQMSGDYETSFIKNERQHNTNCSIHTTAQLLNHTTQSTTNKQPQQNTWKFKAFKVFLCFRNLFPISWSFSTTLQSHCSSVQSELLNWKQTNTTQLNTRKFKGFEVFLCFGNVFLISCSISTTVRSILLNCLIELRNQLQTKQNTTQQKEVQGI